MMQRVTTTDKRCGSLCSRKVKLWCERAAAVFEANGWTWGGDAKPDARGIEDQLRDLAFGVLQCIVEGCDEGFTPMEGSCGRINVALDTTTGRWSARLDKEQVWTDITFERPKGDVV